MLGLQLQCQFSWQNLACCASQISGIPRSHLLEGACSLATWLFIQADGSGWASSMSLAIMGPGYDLCNRQDDMDHIDIQVLFSHLRQRRDAVWDNLNICPRTCPIEDSHLCTYKNWFARPAGRHARSFLTFPFPCAACSAYCASEWAATSCPGTLDAGFVCQD